MTKIGPLSSRVAGPSSGYFHLIFSIAHATGLLIQGYHSRESQSVYNQLRVAHIHELRNEYGHRIGTAQTFEHSIVGRDRRSLSKDCDIGSFVCYFAQLMVGMVISRQAASGITYFTHVEDLVPDIKDVTGAKDVRLPFTD